MRKVNEIAQGKRVHYYCLPWTIIHEEHDKRILCLTVGQVWFRHAKRKPAFFSACTQALVWEKHW